MRQKALFFFLALTLLFTSSSTYALHRDYARFYVEDGELIDIAMDEYLDKNRDAAEIFYYSNCIDHFDHSYNPSAEKIQELLKSGDLKKNIPKELLYLIPPFPVPGGMGSDAFKVCGRYLDRYRITSCEEFVVYPGYLDYDFYRYDPFLEEQLLHYQETPSCSCYFPEFNQDAGRINDLAYLLFKDVFKNSALSKLINDFDEQVYILDNFFWELSLHGLCVSCTCRSFWFSHYYRVGLALIEYAKQDYQANGMCEQDLNQIEHKTDKILQHLAKEFYPFYQSCLKKHPSNAIEEEIIFLQALYPDLAPINLLHTKKPEFSLSYLLNSEQDNPLSIKEHSLGTFRGPNSSKNTHPHTATFDNSHKFLAEFNLYQGLFRNDILDFKKAITCFDKSLKYDSRNKLTYLARAYAWFELNHFDQALTDYAIAKTLEITPPLLPGCATTTLFSPECNVLVPTNRIEFSKGFILGAMQGFNTGSKEFIPSVLHTITGIGQALWIFSKDPVYISQEFMETIGLYVALAREHADREIIVPEMNELLCRWARLSDFEKGRQIAFVIGKYGIDIFLAGKTVQLIRKFREVKYANGGLTLEACEKFAQRKAILEEAKRRVEFRKTLFEKGKIKLNEDKQLKHMIGTEFYKPGKSPIKIEYEKLEKLCEKKAGTGEAAYGEMGKVGYKERVDFEEFIGDCIYDNQQKVKVQEPTTIGILHYEATGSFHVVPGRPKKMTEIEVYSYHGLIWSAKRALIEEIPVCFRGVAVEWQKKTILLYFYIEGEVSEDLHDDCSSIGTEIIACYTDAGIEEYIIRLDYPNPLPKHNHWAFLRKEDLKKQEIDFTDYEGVELSTIYALLGNVHPYLRGVGLETFPDYSSILFYINGEIDSEMERQCQMITEQVKSLNPGSTIHMKVFRKDYPERLNFQYREFCWVFLIKEPHSLSDNYASLLGLMERVLLGKIEPNLRGVAVEWQRPIIQLNFYFDGMPTKQGEQHLQTIEKDLNHYLYTYREFKEYQLIIKALDTDPNVSLSQHHHWAFIRCEPFPLQAVDPHDYIGIRLSVQYALLGKVIPSLREVGMKYNDYTVYLYYYFDGPIDISKQELCQVISEQVRTFNPDFKVDFEIQRADIPSPLPKDSYRIPLFRR